MAEIRLRWVEGKMMVGSDSNGHSIVIGPSPDPEHKWAGVKPAELLLMAVASCSAYDVVEILTKQRQQIEGLKVICTGEQQSDPPYYFTNIHVRYEAQGKIDLEKLEKAIQLSEDKYCSVINTLKVGVSFSKEFEVLE